VRGAAATDSPDAPGRAAVGAHADNVARCSDGDGCTGGDACVAGACVAGTTPMCEPDCVLGDLDNDGICDDHDDCFDQDGDGYGEGDGCEPDCNDEVKTCTTDCVTDRDGGDGNGIPDCEEAQCIDLDGDGYGEGDGCAGPDCNDDEPNCAGDCTDSDNDQTPNCIDSDDDDDGLSDEFEVSAGSDPTKDDTDSDGVSDSDEVLVYETDPAKSDSDGDGTDDQGETDAGTDPIHPGIGGHHGHPDARLAPPGGCAGGQTTLIGLALLALVALRRRSPRLG